MATKSFMKEFSVNRENAGKVLRGLNCSKPVSFSAGQRVTDVKGEQLRKMFAKDITKE